MMTHRDIIPTHAIHAPTPDVNLIQLYPGTHFEISLHYDTAVVLGLLAWSVLGVGVYLYGHGLKPEPKPLFTLICGPAAWMAACWKITYLTKIRRKSSPPPLPQPQLIEGWKMPKHRS